MGLLKKLSKRNTGRLWNYVFYAIGEIFLVVIGIVLAVQFNEWKENRGKKEQLTEHYHNIVLNLNADSLDLERVLNSSQTSLRSAEELIHQIWSEKIDDKSTEGNLTQLIYEYSFNPTRIGIQGLNNSGLIGMVDSDIKRNLLKLDWLYEQIKIREAISNSYISTKYELHFYEFYVDAYNINNNDQIVKSIIGNDKRKMTTIDRSKLLNDKKLEALIIGRIYHLRQLTTLYHDALQLIGELKGKLKK